MGRTQYSSSPADSQPEASTAEVKTEAGADWNASTAKGWPLSFAQQRLWLLEQLEPGTALYNIPTAIKLTGELKVPALQRALNALIARHEALRTRFVCPDEQPSQIVEAEASVELQIINLQPGSEADQTKELNRRLREEINRPFDLGTSPLIRATLLRRNAQEHVLVTTIHHIVADEWSVRICFHELGELYAGYAQEHPTSLPELPIQYADYAVWQRDHLNNEALEKPLAYWNETMAGNPPTLELTTDRPRTSKPTFNGTVLSRNLGRLLGEQVKQFSRQEEATTFMVLLAAFQALVHRYTQQEDLVIATPLAGRNRVETETVMGFFVNTLPLRTSLAGEPSFRELLRRARKTTLGAYAHQEAPFEKVVEVLHPERSLSHLPFTSVMFMTQNGLMEQMKWDQVQVDFLEAETDTSKFDLTFGIQETSHGLIARAEFNTDLFARETIERMLEHFEILLKGAMANPELRVWELPLLSEREKNLLLVEWNNTRTFYPRERSLQELFEEQARVAGDSIAVAYGPLTLTYKELNERANQLAHYLVQFKVGPGVPVGLCVKRSPEMVVGMLGIIKAGGAYVPLDSNYPPERIEFMVQDSTAPVLLTQHDLIGSLPVGTAKAICLDTDWELIARESKLNPTLQNRPDDLAYVMYTSGSTGTPKGVAVPHRAINRLVVKTNYISIDPTDRIAQVSNVSFDAATLEVWGALLNGARLVGIGSEIVLSPKDFAQELKAQEITAMFLTSALFNQLAVEVPGAFAGMRTLIAGGEALDPATVRSVLKNRPPLRLLNGYGPTENTTFTCCHWIKELGEAESTVPIGKPIANTQVYILDAHLNPAPIGVPGELHAAGDGLAWGYWKRPELTAEKFVPNPFTGPVASRLLYKTGDLVRYRANGEIEFLGRLDDQVKLRGFRIELGEVESALRRHSGVRECVAKVWGGKADQKRLVVYFVPAASTTVDVLELRSFLRSHLPEHMIPSAIIQLDSLPLTVNGKVNRAALPQPDQARPDLKRGFIAPRDDVELKLAGIWETVLGINPVGIQDRFFDLGGHSLLAVRVIAQIEKIFGRKLKLATIFQAQTVEELAAILREEIKESTVTTASSVVQIQPRGTAEPLFLVHGAGGGMFWGYMNLSRHLGLEQPVYGLRSRGLDGRAEFETIEEMAAAYVKDLKAVQPAGPYQLGGYCFGGNVAYEMARQIEASGEKVALLLLLNCAPPNSSYTKFPITPAWCGRFARNLVYWSKYFSQWTVPQRREFFRWKRERWMGKIGLRKPSSNPTGSVDVGDMVDLSSFSAEERQAWEAHVRALLRYEPKPFGGRVQLFRSPGHPMWCSFARDYGWGQLAAGGVEITIVPGAHEKILEEPCAKNVAMELENVLKSKLDPSVVPNRNGDLTGVVTPARPALSESRLSEAATLVPASNGHERNGEHISSITAGRQLPENDLGEKSEGEPSAWKADIEFWKRQLIGAPALLELPTDHTRPAQQSCSAASAELEVSPEVREALSRLAKATDVSEEIALLSSVKILLHRYSRQEDILVGTEVDLGDSRANGNSTNLVVVRDALAGNVTVGKLLQDTNAGKAAAQEHCGIPFAKLVEELKLVPDQSYHPICQVLFSWIDNSANQPGARGLRGITVKNDENKFDLEFHAERVEGSLKLKVVYALDLFEAATARRMLRHWETLLGGMNAGQTIAQAPILPAEERKTLLEEWTSTAESYPKDKTMASIVAEQARRTPDADALVDGTTRLTYRELHERACTLAIELRSLGVVNETLVGICVERSWEMVAAILGTLYAGGAYVPLDPAYPKDRLGFILEDAKVQVLVTQEKLREFLPTTAPHTVCVDTFDWNRSPVAASPTLPIPVNPASLGYVIYTSGSTGKPKGVAIEHRNAIALVYWAKGVFPPEELDGVLFATSMCFDLSIFEMFVPLGLGGKIILAENALALPGLPAKNEVRMINTVPSAIRELVRMKGIPDSVKVINLAGEPLPTSLVDQIYSGSKTAKVYDLYGPTETTTYSTYTFREAGKKATIGKPLSNEQVYLLDANQQPVPIGVPGELYIGGDGVARGYLGRPDLTVERFLADPFKAGNRMYRTGDLSRWKADGNLEYLGRIDHQVKIRGFRIELGEIEAVLKKHPSLREVVVMAREDQPGVKRLVAYVAPNEGTVVTVEELRQVIRQKLPEYMLPSAFVFLPALPQTPNGKVDRKALPVPEQDRSGASAEMLAPRSEQEISLAEIWREVLQMKAVGIRDNFFDIGGNSLLAIQIISRIREQFGAELPLTALFNAPTIEAIAEGLQGGKWSTKNGALPPLRPIARDGSSPVSYVQERLWFLDQLNPGSHAYNVPAALRLKGPLDVSALEKACNAIIARHEALRTTFGYQDGVLSQVITPNLTIKLEFTDLASEPNEKREQRAQEISKAITQKPFDMARGPLIRVGLTRIAQEEHILTLVMHHTVSDGWSLGIFFNELRALYAQGIGESGTANLPALEIQYADVAISKRQWLDGGALKQELDYWKHKLVDAPPAIELPLDHADTAQTGRAGRRSVLLPKALYRQKEGAKNSEGSTLFMHLMTALVLTLHKWSGQQDLVVGTVVAGRNRRELENLIGCFMNFLPLRVQVQPDASGASLLAEVRKTVLEAQTHDECPFEKLVETINPERKLNQNPLYNVGFLLQNYAADPFNTKKIKSSSYPVEMEAALLDLRFEAEESENGLSVGCEYKTGMFEPQTIDRLLAAFQQSLRELLSDPAKAVKGYQLALEAAPNSGRFTARKFKDSMAITATFTAEPLAEALRYWIKELDLRAGIDFAPYNQVFQQLLDPAGTLGRNKSGLNVVLLRLEDWRHTNRERNGSGNASEQETVRRHSEQFISALKGAAARASIPWLVCLCPSSAAVKADEARRNFYAGMEDAVSAELEHVSGVYVLTGRELTRWYPVADYSDASGDDLGHVPYTPVFFTSLATAIARKYHALKRPAHKVIVLDCDNTLWSGVCGEEGPMGIRLDEGFVALQKFMRIQHEAGMLLCVCSKNNESDVREVFKERLEMPLRHQHFTSWRTNWKPKSENIKSLARELKLGLDSFIFVDDNPVECAEVAANCPGVLTLQLPEDPQQFGRFLDHCWVFDKLKLTAEDRKRAEMYRQNQQREQLRVESLSLGDFVAGLELKTVIQPLTQAQLARTAQLTQRTNQFNFTTRRRTESEIQALPKAFEVLTVSVSDRFGDYGLTGAVIFEQREGALDVDTFLLSCRVLGRGVEHRMLAHVGEIAQQRRLNWVDVHFAGTDRNQPALDFLESIGGPFRQTVHGGLLFRFPAGFAAEVTFNPQSNEIPILDAKEKPEDNRNRKSAASVQKNESEGIGKFTRCRDIALSAYDPALIHQRIEAHAEVRSSGHANYIAPHNDTERQLCDLWQKLLHVKRVGIQDNFFELGGHSLLAVRLFAEIEKLTGHKLPLVTLFQSPTIRELAKALKDESAEGGPGLLVPLQPNGNKPPLFLVHGAGGDVLWGYANLATHMPADQPIIGIRSRGQAGRDEFKTIEEMAAYYVKEIRRRQPKGPYHIGGYCFGGNIAYEMARQIKAQGEEVALVALLDSAPSNAGYEKIKWWNPAFHFRFARNLSYWLSDFSELEAKERRRWVERKISAFRRKIMRRARGTDSAQIVDLEDVIDPNHFPENELKLWQAHLQALVTHVEQPYDGEVLLMRTRGQPIFCSLENDFCWGALAKGGLRVERIPGSHENIFMEPNVKELARALTACLPQASNQPATELNTVELSN